MPVVSNQKAQTHLEKVYRNFWRGFNLNTGLDGKFSREFKPHEFPSIRSYQDYSIGRPFGIVVGVNFPRKEIRVGAYFHDVIAYDSCYNFQRRWIEKELDKHLIWKKHKTKGSAYYYATADFDEEGNNWTEVYKLMAEIMLKMKNAFTAEVIL